MNTHSAYSVCRVAAVAVLLALAAATTARATPLAPEPPPALRLSTLALAGIPEHSEVLGSPQAPVELLYFGDPQSVICLEWYTRVLPALVSKYVRTGKLQIRWHGFAAIGPESVTGERFIAAAGLQDRLWQVQDDVMANQGKENSGWLNSSLLEQIGASIPGFDVAAATAAANSPPVTSELATDLQQGERAGIEGVPALEYGRRGGPLRPLEFTEFTPGDFERAITRLLRNASNRQRPKRPRVR